MIQLFACRGEMAWDATVCHTCAPTYSYIPFTESSFGSAVEMADAAKYSASLKRFDFRQVVRSSGDSRRLRSQHTYAFQRNRGLDFRSQRIPRRPSRLYREIAAAISQRRLYFQISNTACILEANSRETPASAAKRKAYIVFLDRIGVPARWIPIWHANCFLSHICIFLISFMKILWVTCIIVINLPSILTLSFSIIKFLFHVT